MKVTFDGVANCAYIYLVDILPDMVKTTIPCDGDGSILLDFDETGKLLGIEISDASKILKEETLSAAIRIG